MWPAARKACAEQDQDMLQKDEGTVGTDRIAKPFPCGSDLREHDGQVAHDAGKMLPPLARPLVEIAQLTL